VETFAQQHAVSRQSRRSPERQARDASRTAWLAGVQAIERTKGRRPNLKCLRRLDREFPPDVELHLVMDN
jgi:hypothetical protein